jgi:hypothetical protein
VLAGRLLPPPASSAGRSGRRAPCYLNAVDAKLKALLDPEALASLSERDKESMAELLTEALAILSSYPSPR